MAWWIKYTARAERDLEAAFRWIAQDSPENATIWCDGLLNAIENLAEFPYSGPVAPESAAVGLEIRRLIYGKKHTTYKIFYTISQNDNHPSYAAQRKKRRRDLKGASVTPCSPRAFFAE